MSKHPRTIVGLLFAAVLLDGLDAVSLALIVPVLAERWAVPAAAFTLPLVLTNLGIMLGYTSAGPLARRLGARATLVGGAVLFGLGSLLTVPVLTAESVPLLSLVRVVTGLGLGVVLPVAVGVATTVVPAARRTLVSGGVTIGIAAGSTLGALAGGALVPRFGPSGLFWLGGVLPLLLAAALARTVPSTPASAAPSRADAGVGRLWREDVRGGTSLLWPYAFLVFLAAYTLQSWLPTLLIGYGVSASAATLGLAWFGIGGVLGGIALMPLAARLGLARALALMGVVGLVAVVVAATLAPAGPVLLLVFAVAGFALVAGQIGQLALAAELVPPAAVTTSVGWAATLGRIGSVVAPAVVGALLAAQLPSRSIVLLVAVPVAVAALLAVAVHRRQARHTVAANPVRSET